MDVPRKSNWSQGANNIAQADRLPDGFVRELVNLDPTVGGKLETRAGFTKVIPGTNVRAAFGLGNSVVVVDGADLLVYSADSDSQVQAGTVAASGPIAGAELNAQLYLSTANDSLRFDGQAIKQWAVPAPIYSITTEAGSLPGGIYKFAVTAYCDDGEESGANPLIISLSGSQAVRLTCADSRKLKVYASACNGATLYAQGFIYTGSFVVSGVDDSHEQLTTEFMEPLPAAEQLAAHKSMLFAASGKVVRHTRPFMPHLHDPSRDFFQYPSDVSVMASTDGGLYVVADKTYFVTGIGTPDFNQSEVLAVGAVAGSAVSLPDGSVAWFTQYGLAIGNSQGQVLLPNKPNYAPSLAADGAAGYLEHNGLPMVVTTMRGKTNDSRLAAGDFYSVELTDERC